MSFGWSAGDIATAIAVTYNLVQALDNAYGAANNYREAVAFLGDVKRVLEPLQAFTAWSAYPRYGEEINKQLEQIRLPVEVFLTTVLKYEPNLGEKAGTGRKRSLQTTFRKLDWYIFMEKKVLSLRGKIESHMRILDTLMQRLTLEVVWSAQRELPNTLRSTFEQTIKPSLLVAVRECLLQVSPSNPHTYHEAVVAKLSEHHQLICSSLEDIKQKLEIPETILQQIQDVMLGGNDIGGQKARPGVSDSIDLPQVTHAESCEETPGRQEVASALETDEDSISKICYLILLYFLHFLKGILLALSRMVEPSRALVSTPLAKYNITFLDAIGRPPRVLPFEYFRSFKILQAFIEQEFKDLPGSLWVTRGRYLVLSLRNNQALNERNWNHIVTPGAKIAMSILVRKRLESSSSPDEEQCPENNCSGTWRRPETRSWTTCPVCQKEIYTSVFEASDVAEDAEIKVQKNKRSFDPQSRQKTEAPLDKEPQEIGSDPESESEEEDISPFRRIAREVLGLSIRLPNAIRRRGSSPYESLDPRYREVPLKDHKQFWRVGRVFMMLWTERAGGFLGGGTRNGSHISTLWLGQDVYSEIRRFVVIQEGYGSSICSPIQTYSGQATLKLNLPDRQQHAIIYTSKNVPQELSYQAADGTIIRENLVKDPIRVRSEQKGRDGILDPRSRINYSKIYSVESYVRVLNIGMVDKNSLPSLWINSMLFRPEEPPETSSRRKKRPGQATGKSN